MQSQKDNYQDKVLAIQAEKFAKVAEMLVTEKMFLEEMKEKGEDISEE